MNKNVSRRDLLKGSAAGVAAMFASPCVRFGLGADTDPTTRKRLLFFTKSSTFQHSVIARPEHNTLSFAEKLLTHLGENNGFDVVCTKDGSIFAAEKLREFDVIAFCTTGDLTKDSKQVLVKVDAEGRAAGPNKDLPKDDEPPMTPEGKAAFLEAIEQGKGFIGFHCATDTFHSKGHVRGQVNLVRDIDSEGHDEFDPYVKMIGGEFVVHGKQQKATLKTIDPKWPGASAFNDARFVEEWYSLKNFSNDLHVILAQDCTGMTGPMYQRGPYPETWARLYGKGRVFYTSMGHREDVWEKPEFQALVAGALNWTCGRIDLDLAPNIVEATPEANVKAAAASKTE